ncbi:D-glycero-beta-D-manno-heptose-7-phosphate kinase [Terriglobus saanensis]|uniref:Bifunctional protein HldE n=1 Tax=Terriglobus saanensis (strain ATCC BAA-1853 / DSM 23119 / SP1PR4) TaxID=401053 RepID=E8V059_TERSS|nr:D-glycero-beta-D-manno-heptose-7-phosphate kinase [Terriglobus saanensis]ADV82214.1 rfaE bifunctional protein [Terriglobus saanensis SP1PR4]
MNARMPELHAVLGLLEGGFARLRVLVVGDLMLDRYVVGDVERISPEAPVPILRHVQRYARPGGAANVAMNLAGLGVHAVLAGVIGHDEDGAELMRLLRESRGVDCSCVVEGGRPTISKTRIVSRTQQMLRLDVESREAAAAEEIDELLQRVLVALDRVDAVILSDYAKGALTEGVCRDVIAAARFKGVKVFVDPKSREFSRYAGATTICPNLGELAAATGVSAYDRENLLAAARMLVVSTGVDFLTVTMSEHGIRIVGGSGSEYHSPARAREVADVSGAGDTVIATLAAAMAGGLARETAVELANLAASLVVAKVGTVPVRAEEMVAELTVSQRAESTNKVLTLERAVERVREWRAVGESIVFTNGCFDLLHVGHVTLLEDCRAFGSKLVVGMNTDASVQRLKGPNRPVVGERERAKVMAAMGAVDVVVLFDEDTPLDLIRALRPDVLVKGGDYSVETVVGHEDVIAAGGSVEIVPTVEGFSTTGLVQKLKASQSRES